MTGCRFVVREWPMGFDGAGRARAAGAPREVYRVKAWRVINEDRAPLEVRLRRRALRSMDDNRYLSPARSIGVMFK